MSDTYQKKLLPPSQEKSSAPTGSRAGIIFTMLAVYIIWGSTYLGIRFALVSFPPFLMSGIRFVIAGGLLLVLARLRGLPFPNRAQWIGTLLILGGYGGVSFAEQWVSSGLAAVGAAASPLWTALFIGFMGKWPTRKEWLGLSVGFVGVILLNVGNGLWANPLGAIALILAPIGWALGSAISTRVSLPTGSMASATEMLIGGALLLIVSLLTGEHIPTFPQTSALLALLYLIVFGSLIAYSAYMYLLQHVRTSFATSYAYVNPVIAIFLGMFLASERITLIGVLAMVMILASVVLISVERTKR
jgi:drug/metabolite transporter (DMT)-like permease